MKLSYDEFCDEFTKEVYEAAGSVSRIRSVEPRDFFKSNRGRTKGLSLLLEGLNIAPVIYPDEAYGHYLNGGTSVVSLAREMVESAVNAALCGLNFDLDGICSEKAAECLYLEVLNGERNRGIAENVAHLTLNDLIAVPRWKVNEGSILCTRDFQEKFLKLSDEEMLKAALENTKRCDFSIRGLTEYVCSLAGIEFPQMEEHMYLVLGDGCISGAAAMFSQKMLEKMCLAVEDENYYVIPSSINEVIVVPEWAAGDPMALSEICREVNRTVLEPSDFLSDNVYRYESATGNLGFLTRVL